MPRRYQDGRRLFEADAIEAQKTLKSADAYPALLTVEKDYFEPGARVEGMILARRKSAHTPLRFRDVLRPQAVAANDIQVNAIIRKEDVELDWTTYEPGAAQSLEEVSGRIACRAVPKGGVLLPEFTGPAK